MKSHAHEDPCDLRRGHGPELTPHQRHQSGHVAADRIKKMMGLYFDGDVAGATKMHKELTPVYYGVMGKMPGVMSVKAYLNMKNLPAGHPRLPLVAADDAQRAELVASLRAGGIQI